MRSKAYKLVWTALVALLATGIVQAQTAPVPAVPAVPDVSDVAAVPAVPPVAPAPRVYVYSTGGASNYGGANVYVINSRDSAYRNKMQKLQNQMHALSKEMTELANSELKQNTAAIKQKLAMLSKKNSARVDSVMARNANRTFAYNFDKADARLEKQVQDGDVKEKSKTFSKSYPLDANDAIEISNYYGKINVNTWNKKEVKVDVDIKAYADEDADAQKLLDGTTINSGKDGNVVSFKTDINQGRNSWWGTITNGKTTQTHKVVINYTVYMPVNSALSISNKYGSVNLPDLDGKLNIKNSYGGLVAKTLTNTDNVIVVNYGDANISSMSGSQVNVAYGSLALDECNNLNATVKYSPIKIGKLNTSGVIDVKYGGGLVINDLGKGLKTLEINSSYTPVKLGSISATNADFDVTTHYGEFSYDNTTSITSKTPDNERGYSSTKNYKGHVGKGSSDKVITIKSSYGSVKFD